MKFVVDAELCTGCGLCEDTCPVVFEMRGDGFAHIIKKSVPDDVVDRAFEAEEECPSGAISHR